MTVADLRNNMKLWMILLALVLATPAWSQEEPQVHTLELFSQDFLVDRKYLSMQGPMDTQTFNLLEKQTPELLWIVGYEAVPVDLNTKKTLSQDFLCHSNLEFSLPEHRGVFGWKKEGIARLFLISQGLSNVQFPKGFGVPVMSNETLKFETMLLNLNVEHQTLKMKHRIKIFYMRDKDLRSPMKPLYTVGVMGAKLLEGKDGYIGVDQPSHKMKGMGCSLGIHALNDDRITFNDTQGRKFTGHWLVKPGREVSHTPQNQLWELPFDTTLYYANVHLHPFAQSLELKDLTTGQTVFKSNAKQLKKGIGLLHVDSFSSEKGTPLYKDHEYELITVYNNTTSVNQDAMSTMILYVEDKEFKKPTV